MREIVFDTETTGLDPFTGDKIVEIGAVELYDHMPTGKKFHKYINPLRSMSAEVIRVHGLTEEFLSDKPTFEEVCDEFLEFIGEDSKLVAHNAGFDMRFMNHELSLVGRPKIDENRAIDTVIIARKKFPGSPANLDELCRRFKIDNSARTVHGALLDSELLAEVYLELLGGKEPAFLLSPTVAGASRQEILSAVAQKEVRAARDFPISDEENKAHDAFVTKLSNALWSAEG